jgi:osmotically-inducible protein OsmY
VIYVAGVQGVTNNIVLTSTPHDRIEQGEVERAFVRNAIDATDIKVQVSGTVLTLSGTVNSFLAKKEASRIAWNTPGILTVINEIAVDYEYAFS